MSADFADPHWAFVWPAYAAGAVIIGGLVIWSWRRARFWAKRLEEAEARNSAQEGADA